MQYKSILLFLLNMSFWLSVVTHLAAQEDLSKYRNVEEVHLTTYWGKVDIVGTADGENNFTLELVYTDASGVSRKVEENAQDYVRMERVGESLNISVREPKGFESVDVLLKMPQHMLLFVRLKNGGDITAENLQNGIEINSSNGSVALNRIGEYALINAANGSIDISFDHVNSKMPISLVTMNGEVSVSFSEEVKRDVRLISRKNGFIISDFSLEDQATIPNLNVAQYQKGEISVTTRINNGGSLLFMSTGNGPLKIKKS